jgi:Uma2 family endonuclease
MSERTPVIDPPRRLVEGQRLDQPTFHALYEAMPPGTLAELIDEVVYMPSPVGYAHGKSELPVLIWLDYYAEKTMGVEALGNVTTILGRKNEPQPDALLRILPDFGGQTWNEDGFVHGAPELIAEVAKTTRYVDLGPKLREYERAGVLEYVVHAIDPDEVFWFASEQGLLVQKQVDADGLFRSAAFPGLWLDPHALLDGNRQRLREVVELGCATAEHAAFVARLANAEPRP